jgi:hypothetical protein
MWGWERAAGAAPLKALTKPRRRAGEGEELQEKNTFEAEAPIWAKARDGARGGGEDPQPRRVGGLACVWFGVGLGRTGLFSFGEQLNGWLGSLGSSESEKSFEPTSVREQRPAAGATTASSARRRGLAWSADRTGRAAATAAASTRQQHPSGARSSNARRRRPGASAQQHRPLAAEAPSRKQAAAAPSSRTGPAAEQGYHQRSNTAGGCSTNKLIHIDQKKSRLLFTQ